jgi:hypothetical protein
MNTKRFSFRLLPLSLAIASSIGSVDAANLRIADYLHPATATDIRDRVTVEPALLCNPPLNSVRAAHGNTDWHIDTAHEFLYGMDMGGIASAANHVPATWSREHIHLWMTHTGDYYDDNTVIGSGLDTDSDDGIDQSMLFFYAGHGSPTSWSTLGDHGSQSNVLLGNCGNGSMLRYYWQCSCKVFAHGPKSCGGATWDYGCPQDFDGSADSTNKRNVYERWGPALDSRLRMACGASTSAYCHEDQTDRIWDNYNNKGYDVADSFIFGLHSASGYDSDVVPLCITTGGWSAASTPLYDTTFTNAANPSGNYFHIQYLSSFDTTAPTFVLPEIPRLIPRIRLILPEPPFIVKEAKLVREGEFLVTPPVENAELQLRVNTQSNALYLKEVQEPMSNEAQLSKEEYIAHALRQLEEKGLSEEDMGEPEVSRLMIQRVPREGYHGEISEEQKSVLVSFPRVIKADGMAIKVLGEGSRIGVQLSNDGSPMNTSKVWRQVVPETSGKGEYAKVKPYEAAYKEALKQLGPEGLKLVKVEFGYKAESADVQQEEMGVVYQFVFKAEQERKGESLPPRMVEIPAIETIEW